MSTDRRTLVVVLVALAVAAPAAALRAMCVGRACRQAGPVRPAVPFCSLPAGVRALISAGFYDGRGPHVMLITGDTAVRGSTGGGESTAPWPSATDDTSEVVPLVFAGAGARSRARVAPGTKLDAVAPTVAEAIGLRRPHPGVRSGEPIAGVAEPGGRPRLVLEVVWVGVGTADLRGDPTAWPTLRGLIEDHAGTLDAAVGSLPLDPAAVLTTVGTGALPEDHGITGTVVRNDEGRVVPAWGPGSPYSVVAALGDDLDELRDQRPRIGAVLTDPAERGVIGGTWYVDGDRDDLRVAAHPPAQVRVVERLLADGYGRDRTTDLLAVVMRGSIRSMDRALARMIASAEDAVGEDVLVVVTATGSAAGSGAAASTVEAELDRRIGMDVVEAAVPGGLFLDQGAVASSGVSEDRVIAQLRRIRSPDGGLLFADAFPSVAVTFARFC
ncbi:MAG TPA: hypothetical protein VHH92_05015 [Actinomycetota bacterium]|nr:hypothetical protein [Actinomycetota bacterium]